MLALVAATLLSAAAPARDPASAAEGFEGALSRLRASPEALSVKAAGWVPPLRADGVAVLLADPIRLPERSNGWGRALAAARGLAPLAALASELSGGSTGRPRAPKAAVEPAHGLPAGLAEPVSELCEAVWRARQELAEASAGLSDEERGRLEAGLLPRLFRGPAGPVDPELFGLAARFDRAALHRAANLVAVSVDRAAERLALLEAGRAAPLRTLSLPGCRVAVGGAGDDEYSAEASAWPDILLDLGGRNRYLGAPAAAGPGEVRIVLDLGSEVVIESSGPAASGRFGIGVLHLGGAGGAKRVRGGGFSLGAGFFGAGLAVIRGPASRLESGDFSQGAAAFGIGVLEVEGEESSLSATLNGQGFGYTGGAGLLRVLGRGARLECGLVYPDPRDAAAALSFCQGAGYGPPAFAGGGFGLALIESDEARLESNHFAQGVGYWHGLGALCLHGDRARVQARRYAQGAGIHSGLGVLELRGSRNRLLTWGVGPGFGWDSGVGSLWARGDGNELRSDWAAGKGDLGGHGLVRVEGAGNRLRLGELGTGALKGSAPSYGLAIVSGTANAIWLPGPPAASKGAVVQRSLWGVLEVHGDATFDPGLADEPPAYRSLDAERDAAAARDRERNAELLSAADRLAGPERLARWLFLASEGGLDDRTPGEALSRLLTLPDREAALLPGLASPERRAESLHLAAVLPAYGRRVARALSKEANAATGARKASLVGLFRSLPAREAAPALLDAAADPDPGVRREALEALGSLLDRSRGEAPGRVAFLEESLALCRRRSPKAPLGSRAVRRFGQRRLADLLAALELAGGTPEERLALAESASDPSGTVPARTLDLFARTLGSRPLACRAALARELEDTARLSRSAGAVLIQAAEAGPPELAAAAAVAIGGLGRRQDAARLAKLLAAPSVFVREAAAAGLGRMGASAFGPLSEAFDSAAPAMRALSVAAVAQSFDRTVFLLLARGLRDEDEAVRLTALAGFRDAQSTLGEARAGFGSIVERLAASDPSPSVRVSAAQALSEVGGGGR